MESSQNNTFIDLFAGAGGFSLGLLQAGWKGLAGFEYAKDAAWTYWSNLCLGGWTKLMVDADNKNHVEYIEKNYNRLNIPTIPNFEIPTNDWLKSKEINPMMSLWVMDLLKLSPYHVMETLGIKEKQLGAMVGGPPCQGFSYANMNRDMGDERNQLVFTYMDYVDVFKPKVFLIENVPGILSLGKKGKEKMGPFPKWIEKRANEIGYNLTYSIHNAANFGVPQKRKRVIFYGSRKDLNISKEFKMNETHDYNYHNDLNNAQISMFNDKKEPHVTVFEAIGDLTMPLSSYRDSDAIKLPEGDVRRASNEWKEGEYRDNHGYWHMIDRFTGKEIIHKEKDWTAEQAEHHVMCINCKKVNIKIRKQCHSCGVHFK